MLRERYAESTRFGFRYILDNRKPRVKYKETCPNCGKRKCFTVILDTATGEALNGYGICDHADKCQFQRFPKGKDYPETELFISEYHMKPEIIDHGTKNCLGACDVLPFVGDYERNALYTFLCTLFDESTVSKIFRRYLVGTIDMYAWVGCSIFYQVDKEYVIRTGKVLDYDRKTGKRVRDRYGNGHITWIHSMVHPDYELKQCLFGEHLLTQFGDEETVNLVESEKTAIICSINNPNKMFMATGGMNNLRLSTMEALYGRKITAHPDKGEGYRKWQGKADGLLSDFSIELSDYMEKKKNMEDGDDIADYIIQKKQKKVSHEEKD